MPRLVMVRSPHDPHPLSPSLSPYSSLAPRARAPPGRAPESPAESPASDVGRPTVSLTVRDVTPPLAVPPGLGGATPRPPRAPGPVPFPANCFSPPVPFAPLAFPAVQSQTDPTHTHLAHALPFPPSTCPSIAEGVDVNTYLNVGTLLLDLLNDACVLLRGSTVGVEGRRDRRAQ